MERRPPLGLMPRNIWEEKRVGERISDLLDAMDRYAKAKLPVPEEWVQELRERVQAPK